MDHFIMDHHRLYTSTKMLRITAAFTVDGSKDWLRAMLRVT